MGGIHDLLMDCPVDAVWELASDWANWQRWRPGKPTFELREGENRKAGCLRYAANGRRLPGAWVNERLLAIDNEKHFLSYSVEENEVLGGLSGYIAKVQVITQASHEAIVCCQNELFFHILCDS
jgi:hypothetical protein